MQTARSGLRKIVDPSRMGMWCLSLEDLWRDHFTQDSQLNRRSLYLIHPWKNIASSKEYFKQYDNVHTAKDNTRTTNSTTLMSTKNPTLSMMPQPETRGRNIQLKAPLHDLIRCRRQIFTARWVTDPLSNTKRAKIKLLARC